MKQQTLLLLIPLFFLLISCGESQDQAWLLADQATDAMKDGDWRQAETLLAQAVEIDPGFAEAHIVRGCALEQLKRTDDARDAYLDALIIYDQRIQKKSRDFQIYINRAFLKLVMDDPAGMENDLTLAIEHGLQPAVADVIRQNANQEVENWRAGTPVISPNELAGR
ncbi:MAG: tetratricopeptide repeat protein [Candidatus Hinthialibacter antarcticus]|nr:tetratricopeptide repeat protein [Candidatus Hinthialibacter antarcticus]